MRWYHTGKQCLALRKHVLRVDMRVYAGEENTFKNINDLVSTVKSMLTSAIVKGLDVIGIVSNGGPSIGQRALALAQQNKLDIYVVPGEDYLTADKVRLLIYLLPQAMPPNLEAAAAIDHAHKNSGFVMAAELSKRQASLMNHLKDSGNGPDAVEVYSAALGSYQDVNLNPDFHRFVSSGARAANEMEEAKVFTLIGRKDIEGMGLLPEEAGIDYTPGYLQNEEEIEEGASPDAVAEGIAPLPKSQPAPPQGLPPVPQAVQ